MNRRKKFQALLAITAAAALLLTGCSSKASHADLSEPRFSGDVAPNVFEAIAPDKLQVIINVDGHPNLVRLCVDGLAFLTISTAHSNLASPAVQRMPEWDSWCA